MKISYNKCDFLALLVRMLKCLAKQAKCLILNHLLKLRKLVIISFDEEAVIEKMGLRKGKTFHLEEWQDPPVGYEM